jgi:hypothetical protein
MNKAIPIIIVIAIFIISQYIGISPINIFNNQRYTLRQSNSGLIATDAGSDIYIAWSEFTDKQIILASSTPNSFNIDKIISNTSFPLSKSIEALGSNVYIAWINNYLEPSKIMFSKRDNEGKLSTTIIRETNYILDYPIIKVSGPIVYIAWIEYIDSHYQILLRISYDNGKTFSNVINISNSKNDVGSIDIVVKGRSIYITWHEIINNSRYEALIRYSHDNGMSFSNVIKIGDGAFPIIDVEGSDVYIVFIALIDNIKHIILVSSNDAGNTFNTILIAKNGTLPRLAIEGSLICISWIAINNKIDIVCTIDKNNFVTNSIYLSNETNIYNISIEGSNVYIIFLDGEELKIAVSNDQGNNFNLVILGKGDINKAGVIASGSNLYAIWSEVLCNDLRCNSIDTKVYLRISHDNGKSFSDIITLG